MTEKITISQDQIDKLSDILIGSCEYDLEEACEQIDLEFDKLTLKDLKIIDSIMFQCSDCQWWFSTDEQSDNEHDNICLDCGEE